MAVPFLFLRHDENLLTDLTTINNRLFTVSNPPPANQQTKMPGQQPNQQNAFSQVPYSCKLFWEDLGLVFKENLRLYCKGTR